MIHELKCWPEPFRAMQRGAKTAEFRRNDRDFQPGDVLGLFEWDPETNAYTGAHFERNVTHIERGPAFGIPEGYVVMSLRRRYL